MYPPLFKIFTWLVLVTLIFAGLTMIMCLLRIKKLRNKKDVGAATNDSSRRNERLDRDGMSRELARLRDGGEMNVSLIENMSAEERALFEIVLIDALTKWARDDQHRLRSALIKHGYDEQCSRRLMKDAISDSVRASTLLALLRPQSADRSPDADRHRKTASGKCAN
jgi:hypothetical protein